MKFFNNFFLLTCLIALLACNRAPEQDSQQEQLIQKIVQDEDFAAVVDNQTENKGRYESTQLAINFWLDTNITDIGSLPQEEYLALRERQRQKAAAFGEKLQERQATLEQKLRDKEASEAEVNDGAWKQMKAEVDEQLGIPAGFVERYRAYVEKRRNLADEENQSHLGLYEKYPELKDELFLKRCISEYLKGKGTN